MNLHAYVFRCVGDYISSRSYLGMYVSRCVDIYVFKFVGLYVYKCRGM